MHAARGRSSCGWRSSCGGARAADLHRAKWHPRSFHPEPAIGYCRGHRVRRPWPAFRGNRTSGISASALDTHRPAFFTWWLGSARGDDRESVVQSHRRCGGPPPAARRGRAAARARCERVGPVAARRGARRVHVAAALEAGKITRDDDMHVR